MKKNILNFEVLNTDVLLKTNEINRKTESGIIKSDAMIETESTTMDGFLKVAAVGNDCKNIKIGNDVLVSNGRHTKYDIDGEYYLIIPEIAILGRRIN